METTAIFTRTLTTSTVSAFDLVHDEYSKGLKFVSNGDGTCFVSGIGTCTDTDIKIPPVYNGEKVTSIGRGAFEGRMNIKSITLPEGVELIEGWAFHDCFNLRGIVIPESVTSMGRGVFSGCNRLKNITVPDGVTRINESMFDNCMSLTSIAIPNSVTRIDSSAFRYCTRLENITIPDSVTRVSCDAFEGCMSLKSVMLPKGVELMVDCAGMYSVTHVICDAFEVRRNIKSVMFPKDVELMVDCTGTGITRFKIVTIGNNISSKF